VARVRNADNLKKFLHYVNPDQLRAIQTKGKLLRNDNGGSLGKAIYLTLPESGAKGPPGTIPILVTVIVGKTLILNKPNPNLNFTDLSKQGYDSVVLKRSPQNLWAVYNWDQVLLAEVPDHANRRMIRIFDTVQQAVNRGIIDPPQDDPAEMAALLLLVLALAAAAC
jgi:hypothetical protein